MLKLILILIIFIALYKMLNGTTNPTFKKRMEKEDADDDTLEECATCGVLVTRKEAIKYKGKYFCSKECVK